ncbi:UDP-N-acetylmuramoyl-L-alanyl-D-glutamate--2,6-diaminopimelate ligase [Rhodococcus sp. HNM0569]|uniref:UDP-N-acetylmuramoyl-L-alanyl-D-glutamate--2, 6-diaminopimelate ligase n=1 Tax=Rhodococcus sp. HNM0569 TaxID=2716340 RepID=UPI00146D1845|nr:UDP-N-acetylmuramoyl-L-alanyl-D-glutamate--2,6-diaminopimelate ligase [Rhodococcus sp. HNM0569]NLU82916.1 UDP-N-acetylmuramoyl-L-alanyl-D-glutamate--2,6-diaminopimelate ligase [Rhodococcus sp. HNM0569]
MPVRSDNHPSPGATPSSLRPERTVSTPLTELAELIGARLEWVGSTAAAGPVAVTGVDLRAQAVRPGDLFAALPGARAHGAQFAGDAFAAGAVAVLTDDEGLALIEGLAPTQPVPVVVHPAPRSVLGDVSSTVYGHPSEKMQVLGITGTSGKTTTSYLVEAALDAAGRAPALVGTIETRMRGVRVPSALTTPEAPQLHALFAVMVERGIDTVVMEVSSHALALGRVDGVRFDVGAFTNLSQDHLDFHAGFEDYFEAKARLFSPGSGVRAARAIVCVDDRWGERMAERAAAEGGVVETVSTRNREAGWSTSAAVSAPSGAQGFDLTDPEGVVRPVVIRLPGHYNVANAAVAVAASTALGVDAGVAIDGIADVDVPGRVQRIERGQDFLVVVDYAHKPAALEAVMSTLRAQTDGRVAVVVGAGGDRDAGKRPLMGEVGARGADLLVVTDDNPRSEDPAVIRAEILRGAHRVAENERGEIRESGDRAQAIADAVRWARTGDVVLVAGKGHEIGQEIDGVKHPFDDRDVASAAIDRVLGARG